MKIKILLADDESTFRETLKIFLDEEGMDVTAVMDGGLAIDEVDKHDFDIAILDIQMPVADGIRVLKHIMGTKPQMRVIIITAFGTVEMAVEAIKLGAAEYVMKPVMFDDILLKIKQQARFQKLQNENVELREQLTENFGLHRIIGSAPSMERVFETIRKVAKTKSNVLITGKSGTGKELVARAIHSLSEVNTKRFVAVNCSAIPEGLIESELFGHKKGSFTSAMSDKKGYFETADGGTLFLDEIGYMPGGCQVKLLRALEERKITPVGATDPISIDLRLITATNKILPNEIKLGNFREDLYYRINVVGIHLPPLSERREDIPKLIEHFMNKYNTELGKQCRSLSDEAMYAMMNHEWKGNIRELQNVIERAVIFAEDEILKLSDIGLMGQGTAGTGETGDNLSTAIKVFERDHIKQVLSKHGGNKAAAASALGIGLSSLYRKIDELNIKSTKTESA